MDNLLHEQIGDSIFALGKSIGYTDIIITHLGYDTSREIMEAKVRRNYQLLLKHINEEPLNAYAWFQLGQTLAQMKIIDEAEKASEGKAAAPAATGEAMEVPLLFA